MPAVLPDVLQEADRLLGIREQRQAGRQPSAGKTCRTAFGALGYTTVFSLHIS